MIWFFLALGAALSWGISQVLLKRGFANITPLWNNIIANFISFFLWIPVILYLSGFSITFPSLSLLAVILLIGAFYMSFFYAISKGEIALTGTVVASYPVTTIFLSSLFLNEQLTSLQWFGIALVIFGGAFIALPERGVPKEVRNLSWLIWGIIGAIMLGVGDFLSKLSVNQIGAYSHIIVLALCFNALSVIFYFVDKDGRKLPPFSWEKFMPTLLGLIIWGTGTLSFFLAFDFGQVSLITPVSSIYPAITATLAVLFLKEKVSRKQSFGIASVVLGIVVIGFGL